MYEWTRKCESSVEVWSVTTDKSGCKLTVIQKYWLANRLTFGECHLDFAWFCANFAWVEQGVDMEWSVTGTGHFNLASNWWLVEIGVNSHSYIVMASHCQGWQILNLLLGHLYALQCCFNGQFTIAGHWLELSNILALQYPFCQLWISKYLWKTSRNSQGMAHSITKSCHGPPSLQHITSASEWF